MSLTPTFYHMHRSSLTPSSTPPLFKPLHLPPLSHQLSYNLNFLLFPKQNILAHTTNHIHKRFKNVQSFGHGHVFPAMRVGKRPRNSRGRALGAGRGCRPQGARGALCYSRESRVHCLSMAETHLR